MYNNRDEEREDTSSFVTGNQAYINNSPFMIMRIDTETLITNIQNFLASKRIDVYRDDKGEWKEKSRQIGRPLANEEGIMRICNLIQMRINPHTAQGNFKEDHYWDHIARARKEITETIVKKCYDFEIDDSNLNMVIDELCALIEVFLTRPISNKERESYGQIMQARETSVVQQPKSSWQSFSNGIGRGGMQ